jgi:hypothetical protein
MSFPPTAREHELARLLIESMADLGAAVGEQYAERLGSALTHVAYQLSDYRESVLKPFEELRRDFEVLGDERVAKYLDELIKTARGAA